MDFRDIVMLRIRLGELPKELHHCELFTWDLMYDVCVDLGVAGDFMPNWHRHVDREPRVRHGEYCYLYAEKLRLDAAKAAASDAMVSCAEPPAPPPPSPVPYATQSVGPAVPLATQHGHPNVLNPSAQRGQPGPLTSDLPSSQLQPPPASDSFAPVRGLAVTQPAPGGVVASPLVAE